MERRLVSGTMKSGEETGLTIEQAFAQDATGPTVMLESEAIP